MNWKLDDDLGLTLTVPSLDMDAAEFSDWLMRELGNQLTQTEAAQAERHWEEMK